MCREKCGLFKQGTLFTKKKKWSADTYDNVGDPRRYAKALDIKGLH